MDALQITLADGRFTQADKLQAYFSGIFQAEESGEDFPVDLSHVWSIGYSRKDSAVRALESNSAFVEGVDYEVSHRIAENSDGGRPEAVYMLTVSCLEYFTVRANRAVFEVYRACRKAVRQVVAQLVPQDLPSALRLAADLEEKRLQLQQKIDQDAPKVALAESIAVSINALSFSEAAKWLKIPGMDGRNKLIDRLRADGILMKNREPYQKAIDAGYFEVQPQTYAAGQKGKRMASTTRVTGKGLEWLAKRYRATVVPE